MEPSVQTGLVRALEKSNFCKSVMYVSKTGAFFPRNHVQICTLYNLGILVFMKFLRSCDAGRSFQFGRCLK